MPLRSIDSIEPVDLAGSDHASLEFEPPWQGARRGEGPCEPGQVRTLGPDSGGCLSPAGHDAGQGSLGTDADAFRAIPCIQGPVRVVGEGVEPEGAGEIQRLEGRPGPLAVHSEALYRSRHFFQEHGEPRTPARRKEKAAQAQASPGEPRVEAFVFQGEVFGDELQVEGLEPVGTRHGEGGPREGSGKGYVEAGKAEQGWKVQDRKDGRRLEGGDRLRGDPEDHVLSLPGLIVQGDLQDALGCLIPAGPGCVQVFETGGPLRGADTSCGDPDARLLDPPDPVRNLEGTAFKGCRPLCGPFARHSDVEFHGIDLDFVEPAANEGLRAGCDPCPADVDRKGAFPGRPLEGDAVHGEFKGMCETDSLDLTREAREGANSILRQPAHAVRIQDRPDNKRKSHENQHQGEP